MPPVNRATAKNQRIRNAALAKTVIAPLLRLGMQAFIVFFVVGVANDSSAEVSRRVLASQLAADYHKNGIAADRDYKGRTAEFFGIIGDVRRDIAGKVVVSLNTGDLIRHVRCDFPDSQSSTVAELERGQLVAIRGIVRGSLMGNPQVSDSTLIWSGNKPSSAKSKAETTRDAVIAARSAEVCVLQLAQKELGANVDEKTKRTLKSSLHELEQMKATPLPCPNPLMIMSMICEGDGAHGPECSVPLVKMVITNLKR